MVLEVLTKFLEKKIDRRELGAWGTAYAELIEHYAVDFVPPDCGDLVRSVIDEVRGADLEINGMPILTEMRLQTLQRRVGKLVWKA